MSDPQRRTTARRTRVRCWIVGGVVALLALAVVAGVVVVAQINASRSPTALAGQYLAALAEGDATGAGALVDPGVASADRGLLTDEALAGADELLTDARVLDTVLGDDTATLDVEYRLDGVLQTARLDARRLENELLVLERWELTSPLLSTVLVTAPGAETVVVAGQSVELADGVTELTVYPAAYTVGPEENAFLTSDPVTVAAGTIDDEAPVVTLEPRATEALTVAIDDAVRARLDECVTSREGAPDGCPFTAYSDGADVQWTLLEYPEIEASADGRFSTVGGGVAYVYLSPRFSYEYTGELSLSDRGGYTIDGDDVAIEFD